MDGTTDRIYPTSITPGDPGYIGYPKNDEYLWNEFAFCAIELGGYSDATLVNPYNGDRLWVGELLADSPSWPEMLRRLAVAAELTGFFDLPGADPHGLRADAARGRELTDQEIRRATLRQRHNDERNEMMHRHIAERSEMYREEAEAGREDLTQMVYTDEQQRFIRENEAKGLCGGGC